MRLRSRVAATVVLVVGASSSAVAVGNHGAVGAVPLLSFAVRPVEIAPVASVPIAALKGVVPTVDGGFRIVWDHPAGPTGPDAIAVRSVDVAGSPSGTSVTDAAPVASVLRALRSESGDGLRLAAALADQRVVVADRDVAGTVKVAAPQRVLAPQAGAPFAVSAPQAGGLFSAWTAGGGSGPTPSTAVVRITGPQGQIGSDAVVAAPAQPHAVAHPGVAGQPGGDAVAVWEATDGDGNGSGVRARRVVPNGAVSGPDFLVNSGDVGGDQVDPVVAPVTGGTVVAWVDRFTGGTGASVWATVVPPVGLPVGGGQVSEATAGVTSDPQVTAAGDGAVVTWVDTTAGMSSVHARLVSAQGLPVGGELVVAGGLAAAPVDLQAATLLDDRVALAWSTTAGGSYAVLATSAPAPVEPTGPLTVARPAQWTQGGPVVGVVAAPGGGFTTVLDSGFGADARTFDADGALQASRQDDLSTGYPGEWARRAVGVLPGSPDLRLVISESVLLGLTPGGPVRHTYELRAQGTPRDDGSLAVGPSLLAPRDLSVAAVDLPAGPTLAVTTGGQDAVPPNPFAGNGPAVPDRTVATIVDGLTTNAVDLAAPGGPAVTDAAVAAFTDSSAVAFWTQGGGDGAGTAVIGRRIGSNAVPIGSAFVVDTTVAGDQRQASAATLADGDVVVAWTDGSGAGADTSGSGIKARVVRPDGTFATAESAVNQIVVGDQRDPVVVPLLGDRFLVVWDDESAGVRRLAARMFDATGAPLSAEIEVASGVCTAQSSAHARSDLHAATLGDGRVVVGWSTDQNGYFAILDPHAADVLHGAVPFSGIPGRTALVSLVSTESTGGGYLQVLPCGALPGATSNLNTDGPGQTRAGLAAVRYDGMGRACVYRNGQSGAVADVQGYFAPGAFYDVDDARLLDTRDAGAARPPAAAVSVLHGRAGSTAIISLVATESAGPGYLQVLPCGAAPGDSSNLNVDAAGQTRAALAFARFAADGTVCVYAQPATHVVVDLQGYLAGDAFDDGPDARILDTRIPPATKPAAGSQTTITDLMGPGDVAVVSLTATESAGVGYLQLLGCGGPPGASSNLNVDAVGQTIANLAVIPFGPGECVFTQPSTQVIVDVQGFLAPAAWDDIPDLRSLDTRLAHPQTA